MHYACPSMRRRDLALQRGAGQLLEVTEQDVGSLRMEGVPEALLGRPTVFSSRRTKMLKLRWESEARTAKSMNMPIPVRTAAYAAPLSACGVARGSVCVLALVCRGRCSVPVSLRLFSCRHSPPVHCPRRVLSLLTILYRATCLLFRPSLFSLEQHACFYRPLSVLSRALVPRASPSLSSAQISEGQIQELDVHKLMKRSGLPQRDLEQRMADELDLLDKERMLRRDFDAPVLRVIQVRSSWGAEGHRDVGLVGCDVLLAIQLRSSLGA